MTDKEYKKLCDLGRPLTDEDVVALESDKRGLEFVPENDKFPPLFLMPDRRLSLAAMENLRESVIAAIARGAVIVADPSITVYQLVGGKWELMPSRPLE